MYNLVDKADIVFFDVFDTAIFRRVKSPSDLFDLLGRFIRDERVSAESNTLIKNPYANIEDIYLHSKSLLTKDILKKELELEYQLCYQNKEIYSIYTYAKNHGKKIGFISDMYLSSETILKMLNKCGYDKIDFLYVSCEHGGSKHDGNLYKKVLSELSINENQSLMIGDNYYSDYVKAKECGMVAYHYQGNKILSNEDFWVDMSYHSLGCTVYAFAKYIMNKSIEDKVDKIFFFAREGLIFKKAYDLLNDGSYPTSEYLSVSRKVLHTPILADITEDQFWSDVNYSYIKWYITHLTMETVLSFFSYWSINPQKYVSELEKENLALDFDLSVIPSDSRVAIISRLIRITFKDIQNYARSLKEDTTTYLNAAIADNKNIAIADIGWGATMQESFIHLIDSNINVNGYYYGATTRVDERMDKYNISVCNYKTEIISNNYVILELLLSASHGSVIGYKNGSPVYDSDAKIESQYIHDGVLKFVTDAKYMNIENPINYGVLKLNRLLNRPTMEESIKIGNLINYDGSDVQGTSVAKPDISSLRTQYNSCLNKVMFMKRLHFDLANINW